jgi:Ca2+-transporting ATPase
MFGVDELGNVLRSSFRSSHRAAELIDDRSLEEKRADALKSSKETVQHFSESTIKKVLRDFGVHQLQGLSSEEAGKRLLEHGLNELAKEPPRPFWRLVLDQFKDMLVLMLIASAIVAMFLGQYAASIVIILMVILNAVLGVYQDSKASASLEALESLSSPLADVIRDGRIQRISSTEVVPGDVVLLTGGQAVPADVRLIETKGMTVNEMPLTGESEPVGKDAEFVANEHRRDERKSARDRKEDPERPLSYSGGDSSTPESNGALTEINMAYMSCMVHEGRGKGVVVKTGMDTRMGEIADLIQNAEEGTNYRSLPTHCLRLLQTEKLWHSPTDAHTPNCFVRVHVFCR